MSSELINIHRLKKNGSLDRAIILKIAGLLQEDAMVVMPIDCIYGFITLYSETMLNEMSIFSGVSHERCIRLISSFAMLESIAVIEKLEYDFLHRVWPGEMNVFLKNINDGAAPVPVRMPKSAFLIELIDLLETPLLYCSLNDVYEKPIYKKRHLLKIRHEKIKAKLIIDDFCKVHTLPSEVDISSGSLKIINVGRISDDEIKSLYFLGKDDVDI